jgi:hypothetical protein
VTRYSLPIEVKATQMVGERRLKGLLALRDERLVPTLCIVSRDPEPRVVDGIHVVPIRHFSHTLRESRSVREFVARIELNRAGNNSSG